MRQHGQKAVASTGATNFAAPNMTAIGNISGPTGWDIGSNLPIRLGSAFTIEAWVRLGVGSPGCEILGSADGFRFWIGNSSTLNVTWPGASAIQGQTALGVMTWTHVAATFDGQTATLYVDGAPDVSVSSSGFANSQANLKIGDAGSSADIWSLTLYDFARDSHAEVNAPWEDIGPIPGLVASYDFSVAPPRELIHGLPITPGVSQTIAPAIQFSGQSGVALTPAYSFATTPQYTVSAWVASAGLTSTSGWQTIFYAGDASGSNSDAVWLGFGDTSLYASQQFGASLATANVPINAQDWHNVAMTCDGSTLSLYLDGQKVASAASVALTAGNNPVWRVGDTHTNGNFLAGWVQWLSIWSRALTPDEMVLQMYAEVGHDAAIVVDCPMDIPPLQDVTNTVQMQLTGAAAFGEQRITVSQWRPPSVQVNPPDLGNAVHVTSLQIVPTRRSDRLVHPVAAFSDAHIAAAIAELEPYFAQLHPSVGPQMRAQAEERIRAEFTAAREHPESVRQVISSHREGDEWVFVFHGDEEGDVELLRVAASLLTPCQAWMFNFFFTLLLGVVSILFLKIRKEDLVDWLSKYFLNNQTVMEAVTNQLQQQPVMSATVVLSFVQTIYDKGLLKSFLWFVAYKAGWFALAKAFTYLAGSLLAGGAAAVASWAVQSAVLVVKLALQITGGPNVPGYSASCD